MLARLLAFKRRCLARGQWPYPYGVIDCFKADLVHQRYWDKVSRDYEAYAIEAGLA